jgi:hypothetical protein
MATNIRARFSITGWQIAINRLVDALTVAAVRVVTTRMSSLWSREVVLTGRGQGLVLKYRGRQWPLLGTGSWGVCLYINLGTFDTELDSAEAAIRVGKRACAIFEAAAKKITHEMCNWPRVLKGGSLHTALSRHVSNGSGKVGS